MVVPGAGVGRLLRTKGPRVSQSVAAGRVGQREAEGGSE